ncbi:prolyl oligopeptidase family serine peptidase [Haloferula chungangensis]|uniref:Prolyl oligopeptidase family serine peptidase n=1 Tax=Haloferula chungangensis TaxID=1048331 RepID=A0ABW2L8G7_9BACT
MNLLPLLLGTLAIATFLPTDARAQGGNKVEWQGQSLLDVPYKRAGGREIRMDIYQPKEDHSKAAPVLYYVHGGGWAAGSKDKGGLPLMRPVFEMVAKQGFVCVSINYRLSKNNGVLMRDCVTDAFDGLRFLTKNAERYQIDAQRIVVWGDSAGGQIAQMLALADPAKFPGDPALAGFDVRPLAGISWYGPTDFTDLELFKTDDTDKKADRFGNRIVGHARSVTSKREAYEEMSPYFWLRKNSPPLLLLQGDKDTTIPFAHAPHLKKKADEIGADLSLVVVKNAGHNWRKAGGSPEPGVKEIQKITANFAIEQVQAKPSRKTTEP